MKTTELSPIGQTLTLPGCTFHARGLVVDRELDDAEAQQVLTTVQGMHAATEFWLGDLLSHNLERREVSEEHRAKYLAEFAHVAGFESWEVKRWVDVAEYYPLEKRMGLSFSHHLEAMRGAGNDRQLAWAWLGEADAGGLSPSQFRAKIRKAMRAQSAAEGEDPGPPDDDGSDREVASIERWTLQRMAWAARANPAEAAAVLADLKHTVNFIDTLRDRQAAGPAPGKESITITV